jgi:thiol:disulfide interchange protein DsbD
MWRFSTMHLLSEVRTGTRCAPAPSIGRDAVRGIVQALLLLLFAALTTVVPLKAHAAEEFLEPEKAFRFSAKMVDPKTVAVTYDIADGYYMYGERFVFRAEGATLGAPAIPPGVVKFDETFQKDVETYRRKVTIRIPVEATGAFSLVATSQGCSDKGLCYSPMESRERLSPNGGGGLLGAIAALRGDAPSMDQPTPLPEQTSAAAVVSTDASVPIAAEMNRIESALASGQLLAIVPLFLLLGVGLSFTPCVLPMVPILSSIIVGEGASVGRARGLALAATYSLGMAVVYTGLGVAAGLIGEGLSATLQSPVVLTVFALIMVALALSMFGVYQLQAPAAVQMALTKVSERQRAGKLAGVFAMGAVSALIVGPCVAAPLAGALIYISQTRDVAVGGGALFAMAVGMSVPLLLIGASAGSLLPRAGAWMASVKRFFGVLMLAVALWMVSPVIPAWLEMAGWAALGIGYGAWLLWNKELAWYAKAAGLVFAVAGAVQLAGVATGGRDAWAPLAHLTGDAQHGPAFQRVRSVAELDAALAHAGGRPVMLDFYADWCVSCKEMEKFTFTNPQVRERFDRMLLLQVDVTANNADDKALLKRFNLFGPPGIIFFDSTGREVTKARVIGYQNASRFLQSISIVTG